MFSWKPQLYLQSAAGRGTGALGTDRCPRLETSTDQACHSHSYIAGFWRIYIFKTPSCHPRRRGSYCFLRQDNSLVQKSSASQQVLVRHCSPESGRVYVCILCLPECACAMLRITLIRVAFPNYCSTNMGRYHLLAVETMSIR